MISNKSWKVLGLMSGTSLDGLDIAFVHFILKNNVYDFEIIKCETIAYETLWENKLRNAFNASPEEIIDINLEYGSYLGDKINDFIKKYEINNVDFVASHGHTIFHKPNEGYTLQIGDGQTIANKTNLKVVCDFRTQDVQLGGQGAPLVPIGDELLFSKYTYCLNLGGFANISFNKNGKRLAYDICPTNIVLNHYVKKLGFSFDTNGQIASTGKINEHLLNCLNDIPFYKEPIPKSLGFEFVKEFIIPLIDSYNMEIKDILRTFVAHIVQQLSNNIGDTVSNSLLITGGGVFNTFLIDELKKATSINVILPDENTINFKEALIFAFLGLLRVENQVNCLSSVTGSLKDHSSGKIFIKST